MSRPSRPMVVISAVAVLVLVVVVAVILDLRTSGRLRNEVGAPRFVDATATSGLDHTFDGGDYTFDVGGGVAVFDCDRDGRPDVYVSAAPRPPRCSATRAGRAVTCGSLRRRAR